MFPYFYPKSSFPGPTTRLYSVPTDASSLDGLVSQTILWQGQQNLARQFYIVPLCWLCLGGLETWIMGRKAAGGRTPHPQQLPSSACFNITFHTGKGGSATHTGHSNRSSPARKSFHQSFSSERGATSFPEHVGSTPTVWCSFAEGTWHLFFPFLLPFSFIFLFPFFSFPFPPLPSSITHG